MRTSSSTKCASSCALSSLLRRASSDNPAKSSEFPNSTNRYWLLMALVYHALFRPTHCCLVATLDDKMALKSIVAEKRPPCETSRKQPPKSDPLLTTRQPSTQDSSRKITTPTAESQKGGRTSDARSSALVVPPPLHACANHLRARAQAAEALQPSKPSLS